jgi:hypothetical protein
MSKTHWKTLDDPPYIGAYAFEPDQEIVATIKFVRRETVIGEGGTKEECKVAHFEEAEIKPLILNATNSKTIEQIHKTPFIEDWIGKKIQLYVQKGIRGKKGEITDGVRVRPFVPKPTSGSAITCAECGEEIRSFGKRTAKQLAEYTRSKYGRSLCAGCAKAAAEAADPLGGGPVAENA